MRNLRKNLLILVLLASVATMGMAQEENGFSALSEEAYAVQAGFYSAGQMANFSSESANTSFTSSYRENGVSFIAWEIFPSGLDLPINYYLKQSAFYSGTGSMKQDGEVTAIDEAVGYGFGMTSGVSTYLPNFVENLNILVGAGYHFDCLYAIFTSKDAVSTLNPDGLVDGLIDLSLFGLGINSLVEYELSEDFGVNFGIDLSLDLYSLTLSVGDIASTSGEDDDTQYHTRPGFNFEFSLGVYIK